MRSLTILLTGANGMLARDLRDACHRRGHAIHAYSAEQLDITDESDVRHTIRDESPDVVVNCAAYTNVDGAESHDEEADRVNHLGPRFLAAACRRSGARLVHFSTDYVFGPGSTAPIPTGAPCAPANVYGQTKLDGERAILESGARSLVIRTSWLYAAHGKNFVATMLQLGRDRTHIKVVYDQRGRPTFTRDLADATLSLLVNDASGVFHVANDGECTWFEFAREIFRIAEIECEVEPCTTDAFPRPARRPAYSVLDLSGTESVIGKMRHWRDALVECIAEIEREASPAAARQGDE